MCISDEAYEQYRQRQIDLRHSLGSEPDVDDYDIEPYDQDGDR